MFKGFMYEHSSINYIYNTIIIASHANRVYVIQCMMNRYKEYKIFTRKPRLF